MPLNDTTGTYGVRDCRIIPIIADVLEGVTYGSIIDIVGIQSIDFNPVFIDDELLGDDDVLDVFSKIKNWEFSLKYGKLSFNALATFTGGVVSDAGSTPNQIKTFSQMKNDIPGYFKLIGKSAYSTDNPNGDLHIVFYKCKITDLGNTFPDKYGEYTASGKAIARVYDNKIFDLLCHETAVDIADESSADTMAAYIDNSIAMSALGKTVLAVRVVDSEGNPVPFVKITWEVTSEDTLAGTLSDDESYTDADGIAFVFYTAGSGTGDNTVTATKSGLSGSPVTFTLSCS